MHHPISSNSSPKMSKLIKIRDSSIYLGIKNSVNLSTAGGGGGLGGGGSTAGFINNNSGTNTHGTSSQFIER